MPTTTMLVDPLTKDLPICVFQEYVTRIRLLGAQPLCLFIYFIRKPHTVSLLNAHFEVCHYLMILCHFDQMNDKMRCFLSIELILLSL